MSPNSSTPSANASSLTNSSSSLQTYREVYNYLIALAAIAHNALSWHAIPNDRSITFPFATHLGAHTKGRPVPQLFSVEPGWKTTTLWIHEATLKEQIWFDYGRLYRWDTAKKTEAKIYDLLAVVREMLAEGRNGVAQLEGYGDQTEVEVMLEEFDGLKDELDRVCWVYSGEL